VKKAVNNNNEIINMKKNILLLVMSLLLFMAPEAHAQKWRDKVFGGGCVDETHFYGKILSGATFLQNGSHCGNKTTYETGNIIAGTLGYCWNYGLCLEAEYAYRRNAIKKIHFYGEGFSNRGHFQASSYMANLLWDVPLSLLGCVLGNIQPFIGAGIGYDFQNLHSSNSRVVFNQKWKHFSWQMIAGLAYPIFCNTEITLEYNFHQGGCHFNNHTVGIGLLYTLRD